MNRSDFQRLSGLRWKEANVLLKAGCNAGAYYLMGYAVECALKACIAKRTKEHDFPDRDFVRNAYTHDLRTLIKTAELGTALQRAAKQGSRFARNWATVKDWSEASRYDTNISPQTVVDYRQACLGTGGVLTWIKQRW